MSSNRLGVPALRMIQDRIHKRFGIRAGDHVSGETLKAEFFFTNQVGHWFPG